MGLQYYACNEHLVKQMLHEFDEASGDLLRGGVAALDMTS